MENPKSKKNSPKASKTALLLTQDLNYARNLAANDEKVRNRSLKYLKKYLGQRTKATAISEDSLKIIWKGLFYSMWMSDKPQVQEDCAENISNLIHSFEFDEAMQFFKIGLITLQNEWVGIDQLRLDKFLMLVRRLLRQALFVLKKNNFKKLTNEAFTKVLEETILSTEKTPPLGLVMHFIEIYLEELAKVSDGMLQKTRTIDFLRPFINRLAFANDARIIQWIIKFIFTHLMQQHKLGLEYEEKYKIWKAHGFEGSINQIQKVIIKDSKNDETEKHDNSQSIVNKPLDPRAGNVNVELPPIVFDAKEISEALLIPKSDSRTTSQTRNHLTIWSGKFMTLYEGVYPLGAKNLESRKRKNSDVDTRIDKAAKRLMKFEENLLKRDEKEKRRKSKVDEEQVEEEPVPKKKKKNESPVKNESLQKENSKKQLPENKKKKVSSVKNESLQKQNDNKESPEKKKKKESPVKSESLPQENGMKESPKKRKNKKPSAELVVEAPEESKKTKAIKKEKINDVETDEGFMDEYNFCFERNSGVWFVTPEFDAKLDKPKTIKNDADMDAPDDATLKLTDETKKPRKTKNGKIDNLNGNDELKEGEYEIFVPSKKFIKKLKKTKSSEQIEEVLGKLRGKNRVDYY
ncbi:ribosomal RNA processing protein 1 homolog isoform X2 [Anthonomus grandis grandis]|uniref:ribosomal RNA processing protein 1 homolog isoform X2 n=1 Tax=Anthonomus grandis grandis TaxID=2921223 RepID=UPI002166871A|nr:ribosomal RNA processing protein 1 homolog isoform X2 [Anthonomus grandis grandis]